MNLVERVWAWLPPVRKRRQKRLWLAELERRREILHWEITHLPEHVQAQIVEPLGTVTGMSIMGLDAFSIERCGRRDHRTTE